MTGKNLLIVAAGLITAGIIINSRISPESSFTKSPANGSTLLAEDNTQGATMSLGLLAEDNTQGATMSLGLLAANQ